MEPKLNENLLAAYPGMPREKIAPRRAPHFEEALYQLASAVPEYGIWQENFELSDGKIVELVTEPTRRALEQVLGIFFRDLKKRETYSDRQIEANIAKMLVSIRSRLSQLQGNQTWLAQRKEFESRLKFWVDKKRRDVLNGQVKLRHLPDISYPPFVAASDDQFRGTPANFPKIIQARLSNPTERMIIAGEVDGSAGRDIVSDLILDPAWITDRQVEDLGFRLPWHGKKRTPATEKLEFKAEIIGRIKAELQALRLIGDGQDGHADSFGKYRLYASRDGQIIGTTNINSEKPTIYKASLLDAIRRTEHIDSGSGSETRELSRLIDSILSFDLDVGKRWKQVQSVSELDDAKALLADEMVCLARARNKDKKEAKELLEKAMTLDSTYTREIKKGGKTVRQVTIHLPYTARRGQLYAAIDRLRKRLAGGGRKIPRYNANDRTILQQELGRNEAVPFSQLLAYLDQRHTESTPLLDSRKLTPEQRRQLWARLRVWIQRIEDPFRKVPLLEPYHSFSKLVAGQLQLAHEAVQNEQCTIADLRRHLDQLSGYLLLHHAWKNWELLYDRHLGNNRLPIFYKFAEELRTFRRELPASSPDGEPEPTAAAFLAYETQAGELISTCQTGIELLRQPGGKAKADRVRQELKRQMRLVDIIRLLQRAQQKEEPVPPTLPSAKDIQLPVPPSSAAPESVAPVDPAEK